MHRGPQEQWDSAVSPSPTGWHPPKQGWKPLTSTQYHLTALTRSCSLDSITVGPLGPGGPATPWVTMTTPVMLAAAHKPSATPAAPPTVAAAGRPHGTAPWDLAARFGGEQGTQIVA